MREAMWDGREGWSGAWWTRLVRSLCVAVWLIGAGVLAACNLGPAQVDAPHKPAATATPQPPASPTATLPASGPPAILGAAGQTFITKYGTPTSQSNPAQGELDFDQYAGLPTDYLVVEEGLSQNISPGEKNAVGIVVAAPPGQPWTVSAAKQTCAGFGPTDAQKVRSVKTSSMGAVVGWDEIYQSDQLAAVFPASAFVDASKNLTAAGSFDISYIYASSGDTEHVTSCSLAIGERQTVG